MVFGGGGGKSPMSRTDLRIVAIVIGACLSVFLAWLSDQAVFCGQPQSHFQALIAYVATFGYWLTDDRFSTFLLSVTIFFSTISAVGFAVFYYLEIHVIEPLIIRRKMMYVRREKALMNKYDDGTL